MTTAQLENGSTTAYVLRRIGGPAPGAGRLLKAMIGEGLDEMALLPAAALAVELDEWAWRKGQDPAGQRYGHLVVIDAHCARISGRAAWLVQCDCGNRKVIRADSIRGGGTKSCGCRLPAPFKRFAARG